MNTDLILEITDLAWTITKSKLARDPLPDDDLAESVLAIARNAIQAYEQYTGLRVDREGFTTKRKKRYGSEMRRPGIRCRPSHLAAELRFRSTRAKARDYDLHRSL